MNEKGMKIFWLGLFIIGALALTIWLLLFLRPSFGDGKNEIRVRFTNIERVTVGTRVTYAGKPVGKVVAINEIFDARELPTNKNGDYYFYELVLRVDSSIKVYSSDKIIFTTTGLFGEKSVSLIPKPPKQGEKATEVTTTVLYADSSGDLDQVLTHFADLTEPLKEMLISLKNATDQLTPLLANANRVELVNEVKNTFSKFSEVMQETLDSDLIPKLSQGATEFTEIGKTLNNNDLYCQITTVLSDLHRLIYDINNYGLLFQYNKKWQRKQMIEACCDK